MIRRSALSISALLLTGVAAAQSSYQVPLLKRIQPPQHSGEIKLSEKTDAPAEDWGEAAGERIVRNVTQATLTPVLPKSEQRSGAAVIIVPGGGFVMLSIDTEGYDAAKWLADKGGTAFVLKYRTRATPPSPEAFRDDTIKYIQNMLPSASEPHGHKPEVQLYDPAVEDLRNAINTVRRGAKEWKIDPERLGVLGFSAGAMTTLAVGLDERNPVHLAFIAPIYGPLQSRPIPPNAPALFSAIAADDVFFTSTDIGLLQQYREAARPFELHLFERGGHGFGMRHTGATSDMWIDEFLLWMKARGLLTAQP